MANLNAAANAMKNDPWKQAQQRHYDAGGRVGRTRILERFLRRRRAVLDAAVPWPATGAVLDVGCGEGQFLEYLFLPRGYRLFGLDLSEGNVAACRARLPDAHVTQGDAEQLPYAADQFDVVFVNGVFHHVKQDLGMAAELVRVARPGGWLAIIEPNRRNPLYAAVALAQRHERGLLRFDARRLFAFLAPRLEQAQLVPFSHFDFPFYGFPPAWLEPAVDRLQRGRPRTGLHTHFLLVGRKPGAEPCAAS